MKIEFKTPDNDDGFVLGWVTWPAIPRVGEHVVLDGLLTEDQLRDKAEMKKPASERVQCSQHFVVMDIVWRTDMNGERKADGDPDVEVWLALTPEERVWEGAERG